MSFGSRFNCILNFWCIEVQEIFSFFSKGLSFYLDVSILNGVGCLYCSRGRVLLQVPVCSLGFATSTLSWQIWPSYDTSNVIEVICFNVLSILSLASQILTLIGCAASAVRASSAFAAYPSWFWTCWPRILIRRPGISSCCCQRAIALLSRPRSSYLSILIRMLALGKGCGYRGI